MKQKRVSGILRVLVGVYLSYLAFGLLDEFQYEKIGDNNLAFGFGLLYLVVGIALMVWGGLGYYKASKQQEGDCE